MAAFVISLMLSLWGVGAWLAIHNLRRPRQQEIAARAESKKEINRRRAAQLGLEIVRPNE